jgi:putative transposase
MPRLSRVVLPGLPYHVTHRGNRGQTVFFSDDDRRMYLHDLARCARDAALAVWGYCLMTNHVHLIAVPARPDSLARGIGRAHQRHTRRVNRALRMTGLLWGERFYSTVLDEPHLWTAIKYVELNPVRAGLVRRGEDWIWSSARAHAGSTPNDPLLDANRPFGGSRPHPLTGRPISWSDWLALGLEDDQIRRLRRATSTGRPCGADDFVRQVGRALGRDLTRHKPGPKPPTPTIRGN